MDKREFWVDCVLFFLSVWRVSVMVVEEEGPGDVFVKIKEMTGAQVSGIPVDWQHMGTLARLTQCPWCLSVWVGLALSLIRLISPKTFRFLALALAGSAATVLIEEKRHG